MEETMATPHCSVISMDEEEDTVKFEKYCQSLEMPLVDGLGG